MYLVNANKKKVITMCILCDAKLKEKENLEAVIKQVILNLYAFVFI